MIRVMLKAALWLTGRNNVRDNLYIIIINLDNRLHSAV